MARNGMCVCFALVFLGVSSDLALGQVLFQVRLVGIDSNTYLWFILWYRSLSWSNDRIFRCL
jgi:hypothetical protein